MDLPKSTWYYHRNEKVSYQDKYAYLLPELEAIAQQHPEYGWPRVTAQLQQTYGHYVNHKVVQRLLRLRDLRLRRSIRRPKPGGVQQAIQSAGQRANLVAQRERIELFQVIYTDFTELRFADGRHKASPIPIIGHVSKMAYGWAVGTSGDTVLGLQAWQRAKETLYQLGVRWEGMILTQRRHSALGYLPPLAYLERMQRDMTT